MNPSRRDVLIESGLLGAGIFCSPLFMNALRAASDRPVTGTDSETVCPKSSPPADTLWAIKVETLEPGERLTLSCLQGLVNREQPRIYLAYDHYDELWLDWMRERGDVKEIRWVEPKEAYDRYLSLAKGLVVTDPRVPGSVNVATMLGSLEDWLPVVPDERAEFAGLKVAMDLSEKKWTKNIEAYRWCFSNHGERMSKRVCAHYDPGQFELRDYFFQFKVPMIWISSPKDTKKSPAASPVQETRYAHEFFAKLPPNIPCMGWWDNGVGGEFGCGENGTESGMDIISQHGKFEICTGFDGYCQGVGNLSVHSGTSAKFRQKSAPPLPTLDKGKVYYTYTRTDGDGPNFYRQAYRLIWDQPDHGKVPVGWQLGPTASDLIPDILDYFYKHATPGDVFVNALTGVGYIHENCFLDKIPQEDKEAVWKQYLDLSARYMKRLDLSQMTTFEADHLMSPESLARFAGLPGLTALYRNYHIFTDTTLKNAAIEVNGIPVFRTVISAGNYKLGSPQKIKQAADDIVKQVRKFTPAQRPGFLHMSLTNWYLDSRVLVEVEKALGPDYIAVRADQLPALYREAKKMG